MPSAARTKTCAFIGVNLRAPGEALYLGAMQPDLRILAVYFRGLFYRYANPRGGICLRQNLLTETLVKRRMLAPHPADAARLILTLRGERYAKDIVHKILRPVIWVIVSWLLIVLYYRP